MVVMARTGDVRGGEFVGKRVGVYGDEGEGHVWVRERHVVNGEEVGREDGGGAVENSEFVGFREMTRTGGRGLCNVHCVA